MSVRLRDEVVERKRSRLRRLLSTKALSTRRTPLSFGQERLWFLERLRPGESAYNVPVVLRLKGELDSSALRQSVKKLVERHETLRTSFRSEQGKPVQVVSPAEGIEIPLPVVDVNGVEAEALRQAAEEAHQVFDLRKGPLLRGRLLRVNEREHLLALVTHHIVSDGWSMGVLLRELGALYGAARKGGEEAGLEPLPIQYADYAVWQRQWLQGEVLERQMEYWRRELADVPVLELPTDRRRPAVQSYRGARVGMELGAELGERLRRLSQQEGVTLFMTLLAGFEVLLQRYSGQDDIVVGTAIANRTRREVEGLIGMFVNTLVLRTDLSGDPSFRQLLGRVRETTLGAYAHQDLPFEKLVEELRPQRDVSRPPLFQVSFILQNAPWSKPELAGLEASLVGVEHQTAKFDLSVSLGERGQKIVGGLEYNTDLFEAATIERMAGHYRQLLETAVVADLPISRLPLITNEELVRLTGEFNKRFN